MLFLLPGAIRDSVTPLGPGGAGFGLFGAGFRGKRCRLKKSADACSAFRPSVHFGGAGTPHKIKLAPVVAGACAGVNSTP